MWVVTPAQMKAIDERAIKDFGIPGIILMENAALQVVSLIEEKYPLGKVRRVVILAGFGNNGGDGFAVARHLHLQGYQTTTLLLYPPGKEPAGDAGVNLGILKALGANVIGVADGQEPTCAFSWLQSADLIVDALFGTGLDRPVTGLFKTVIQVANGMGCPIVSIDIPSGVHGENGHILGVAIKATDTVTFGYLKPGHLLFPGREYGGVVHVKSIFLPLDSAEAVGASLFSVNEGETAQRLKERPRDGHKGTFGRVGVIAGSTGLTGAAYLTSMAALRSGAGLVTLAVPASLNGIMEEKLTEVMTLPLADQGRGCLIPEALEQVLAFVQDKDILAFGPGCGKNSGVFEIIRNILGTIHISIVIDADGLNHISKDMNLLKRHSAPVILTPHPGEMARLAGLPVNEIVGDPVKAAVDLAREYQVIVLLKGASSIVADPLGRVYINSSGNVGMAKGGSGDVLTGMIASLAAQGYTAYDAAVLGCYLHGCAGDAAAARYGDVGMTACDLLDAIPCTFQRVYRLKQ